MAAATLEREEQTVVMEKFMDYRIASIEKKLDDVVLDIREVRTSIHHLDVKIGQDVQGVRTSISNLDAKMGQDIQEVRTSISNLDAKIGREIQDLRASISSIDNRSWLFLVGIVLSILGPFILRFL